MHESLIALRPDMEATVALVASLKFPDFERPTEYVALTSDDGAYPLLSGDIGSTDGVRLAKKEYRRATNEKVVPHSSAKHTHLSRDSYTVGALARFNLNHDKLLPRGKEAARVLGLKAPSHNPFLNTVAQTVEAAHCLEEAIGLVGGLLEHGVDRSEALVVGINESNRIPVRAGEGVGAIEAPRGILFHRYRIDAAGIITRCRLRDPDEPEPREHRAGHARLRARHPAQERRRGHAGARDAGALLRPLHLLLHAPGPAVGAGRFCALAALRSSSPPLRRTTRTPPRGIPRRLARTKNRARTPTSFTVQARGAGYRVLNDGELDGCKKPTCNAPKLGNKRARVNPALCTESPCAEEGYSRG